MAQFKPDPILTCSSRQFVIDKRLDEQDISRGSSVVERGTHNPEVGGAKPSPASLIIIPHNIILGYN